MRINRSADKPAASTQVDQAEPKQSAAGSNPGTDLALVPALQTIVPAELFKPQGSDAVLTAIEVEVRRRAAELDISTEERRKAIASLAYQVSRTKTGIDQLRKDLVADEKERIKAIDREGAAIWDRVEALQAEVRKPLTDWEQAQQQRVADHEKVIAEITELGNLPAEYSIQDVHDRIAKLRAHEGRSWEEFAVRAGRGISLAGAQLGTALENAERREAEREELRQLRLRESERKEAERRQAIADEAAAAERARQEKLQAEQREAAEAERLRIESERNEAAAKAEQAEAERVAAEQRAAAALREAEERRLESERAAELEKERLEQEARDLETRLAEQRREAQAAAERERLEADRRAQEAAEKAERDRDAAVRAERERVEAVYAAERQRQEAERERVRAENEARESNRMHRRRVEGAIIDALSFRHQLTPEVARAIVVDINEGAIPGVSITY